MLDQIKNKKIEELSFEEALNEMERIAEYLEKSNSSLEEVLALFERITLLKEFCEETLSKAKIKIEQITALSKQNTDNE